MVNNDIEVQLLSRLSTLLASAENAFEEKRLNSISTLSVILLKKGIDKLITITFVKENIKKILSITLKYE